MARACFTGHGNPTVKKTTDALAIKRSQIIDGNGSIKEIWYLRDISDDISDRQTIYYRINIL